jgi:hypothetical protein
VSEVRLCKDCKFSKSGFAWIVCTHPKVPLDDLATGEHKMASSVRNYGPCGKSGAYFESKRASTPAINTDIPELEPMPGIGRASRVSKLLVRLARWARA